MRAFENAHVDSIPFLCLDDWLEDPNIQKQLTSKEGLYNKFLDVSFILLRYHFSERDSLVTLRRNCGIVSSFQSRFGFSKLINQQASNSKMKFYILFYVGTENCSYAMLDVESDKQITITTSEMQEIKT